MSKSPKRLDGSRQLSIFEEMTRRQSSQENDQGAMRVTDDLKASLNKALKQCPLSRHLVAGQMSHLLNEEISKAMVDSWTAESKPERRIPADYVPAFCAATGFDEPLEILNRKRKLFVLQGPDALRSEIQQLREQVQKANREIRRREQLLQMFNGQVKQ